MLLLPQKKKNILTRIKFPNMSKTSNVVDGEASESDTELEIGKSPGSDVVKSTGSTAFVFDGEAPESDDDSKLSTVNLEPDLPLRTPATPTSPNKMIYTSLLHQKLWECNVSLRATIQGLLKHTTDISVEKLSHSDKILLNVQESMRSTNANLTLARARLKQMKDELEKANCGAAFPTVKIK